MVEHAIKKITSIARTPELLIREFVFAPGEATAWHRHSAVTDLCYGLEGRICVERRDPEASAEVAAGAHDVMPPGRVHRLINLGADDARILLIQHGGAYDFVAAPD